MSESKSANEAQGASREGPSAQARTMFETMAKMQDEHNCLVHPQWREQGFDYYRAIWVECAELLDHFGWKWWKHQSPDMEQSRLELVDIWHFGLSELIRDDAPLDQTLAALVALPVLPTESDSEPQTALAAETFRGAVEALAGQTLQTKAFPLPEFVAALAALPMSYAELFELYIGKNVLNRFRQTHGYKEGTYRKLWAGHEDNEHLMEVLAEVPVSTPEYVDTLYSRLEARYLLPDNA